MRGGCGGNEEDNEGDGKDEYIVINDEDWTTPGWLLNNSGVVVLI